MLAREALTNNNYITGLSYLKVQAMIQLQKVNILPVSAVKEGLT